MRFGKSGMGKILAIILSLSLLLPAFAMNATAANQSDSSSNAKVMSAGDLRVTLDRLLGEHAYLAIVAMQKGIDGSADFGDASNALLANADDLSAAVGLVYGDAAGAKFKEMWKGHIGYFVDYVKATASNDSDGQQQALDDLAQYRQDFSNFLAGANPNIDASGVADGLQVHVNQLIGTFNDYHNGNYADAYDTIRDAYKHMYSTGDGFAAAIAKQFPDKFPKESAKASVDLRVTLDRLLGEHAALAMLAMQKGIDGAPDFNNSANILLGNADDLSAAVASVYGDDAGAKFKEMWKAHIGYFVDYVTATAKGDADGKQMALNNLAQYRQDFSNFLAGANPNIEASGVADGLQVHVNQLIGTFNDYHNGNYADAYDTIRAAYKHMFSTGDGLAAAIVKQYPDKFGMMGMTTGEMAVKTPAVNLRASLSQLLSTHFIYQIKTTLAAYNNAKSGGQSGDDLDAAKRHLESNGADLTAAVKSVYGQDAADAFDKIFDTQYSQSGGYGKALGEGDQQALNDIKNKLLVEFPQQMGGLLSSATGGKLPEDTAVSVLKKHEQSVMDFISNYIAGNYDEAYQTFDDGYKLMYTISKALSGAIVTQSPDKFDNTMVSTPAGDLRITMNELLGLHFVYQTGTTMEQYKQAIGDGGEDANAVQEMQESNAKELGAAVKSVYGQDAADAFMKIFNSQYTDSAGYGKAVANGNTEKAAQVRDHLLNSFAVDLGTLLSNATEMNLPKDTAITVLQSHEQSTLDVVNAYRMDKFNDSYDYYTSGHALMATIGTALAGAIATQMPDKFGMMDNGSGNDNGNGGMNTGDNTVIWITLGDNNLKINNKTIWMDVAPFAQNDRTYVSLRFITEGLGAQVSWDGDNQKVTVKWGDNTAVYWLGKDYMDYNGTRKDIGVAAFAKNQRTQVPVRFIAELMGWKVDWMGDNSVKLTDTNNAAQKTINVDIQKFSFNAQNITIQKGTTVTFTNQGFDVHTATADDGSFDTGNIGAGESKSITFNTVGEFPYHCIYHTFMTGKVTVTE